MRKVELAASVLAHSSSRSSSRMSASAACARVAAFYHPLVDLSEYRFQLAQVLRRLDPSSTPPLRSLGDSR